MNVKFLGFERSREDEKHLGVATVIYDDKILLRYKVVQTEQGGVFVTAPSYKDPGEQWQKWFVIDSNIAQEQIIKIVKENIGNSPSVPASSESPVDDETIPF